jgi:PAS domain S-box-containing protein
MVLAGTSAPREAGAEPVAQGQEPAGPLDPREHQLHEILWAVYRLAARDFSYRVPERVGDDTHGYIAVGINMLAQALEETTVSRRYLDSVLETMIDPLFVVSEGGVVRANAAALRELGCTAEQLSGEPLEEVMLLGDEQRTPLTFAHLRACCSGGAVRDLKVRLVCQDGRHVEASVNASTLVGAPGPEQMVLVARNMTEVLGLLDAARDGVRAQADFVATVSHELRTPMQGVIGTTSLMLQSSLMNHSTLSDEQRGQLGVVMRSAETLVTLLDDLLDFSKLDARRMRLDVHAFSVAGLVEDVTTLLESKAREAGLSLTCRIDPALPERLVGDSDRLRQVLTNLCGNAIKFTDQGGAELRVSVLEAAGAERMRLRFEVVDTGIGIAPAARASVFEPFVQAPGTERRRFGGTGLGLAISRHIVRLMGAELWCESEAGRGSRFWFDLELAVARKPISNRPGGATDFAADLRVLVAEDNPTNRSLLVSMLHILGVAAEGVADGQAAVDALAREHYDLVFLDWDMPNLDGPGAARAIRARESGLAHVPVVCMTGYPSLGDDAPWRRAGMDDMLAKPFHLSELNDVLARWLRRDRKLPPDGERTTHD